MSYFKPNTYLVVDTDENRYSGLSRVSKYKPATNKIGDFRDNQSKS